METGLLFQINGFVPVRVILDDHPTCCRQLVSQMKDGLEDGGVGVDGRGTPVRKPMKGEATGEAIW